MKLSHVVLIVALSVVTTLAVGKYTGLSGGAGHIAAAKESAYDRVMRTGTLRCGYFFYPKFFEKDVNTGKLSGFYYDLVEEIGRRLSLKIDWTEEVGMANAFEGLKSNRYDAVCVPFTMTPNRARETEFTQPVMMAPYFAYVRADDTRFDHNLKAINDPLIKVAFLEGELSQTVRNEDFPKSQAVSLPNMTDVSQVLLQVEMGKADVAFTEPSTAEPFLTMNPGKLKRVDAPSIRMQAVGLDVGVGEEKLKALLNTTIQSLHSTGFIERLFIKSEKDKDFYYLPTQPWRRVE
ncbi:MAG: transporter substrate-binding domain-containing protein [Bdellovibrionales bacterium]|jgi:ABC-type amino acid transport substrate-binding protein